MGSDVGVQTPVYHRGSDPEMVFSARSRARMGSEVGVQSPVPPPLGPGPGTLCVALHVTIRYARHALLARHAFGMEATGYRGRGLYYPSHVGLYAAVSAILGQ